MKSAKYLLSLLLCGSVLFSCKNNQEVKEIETIPITFTKEGEVFLVTSEGDTLQQLEVELAKSNYERETGLMYRETMNENEAMLFIFEKEAPRGFYMKNTYIPLDLIFLDADKKIIHIAENAKPQSLETIPSEEPAQFVLEINAGLAEKWGLAVGDSLILNEM